jgi:hypothetical protein
LVLENSLGGRKIRNDSNDRGIASVNSWWDGDENVSTLVMS